MYLEFYKLSVKPFDITTNPKFLWLGEKHREALATLRYGIMGNMGFLLLTGDVGTGKTTLIYSLLNELGPEVAVANVPDPGLPPLDFYNYIAAAFGIEREFTTKGAFLAAFSRFLHEAHQAGKKILLIIDESQRLSDKLLEEIRLLSNIERQETKLINIFFVGQVEFNTVLARHQNRALRQRITVNHHITALTEKETGDYIAHRLKVAGGGAGLFSPEAVHEVFVFSKGYPRLINVICDRALLTGYVEETRSIGPKIIRECAAELTIPAGPSAHPGRERREETPPNGERREAPLPRVPLPAAPPRPRTLAAAPQDEPLPFEPDPLVLPRTAPKPVPSARPRAHWGTTALVTVLVVLGIVAGGSYILFPEDLEKVAATLITGIRSTLGTKEAKGPAPVVPAAARPPALPAPPGAGEKPPEKPAPAAGNAPPVIPAPEAVTPESTTGGPVPAPPQEAPAVPVPETASPPPAPRLDPVALDQPLVVTFDYDSNEMPAEAFSLLERFTDTVNHDQTVTEIILRGYSDNVGSEHYNQRLSSFRAQLVRSFLMGKGLTRIPITIQAMGSKDPLAGNDTMEGRKKNRRVELRAVRQ